MEKEPSPFIIAVGASGGDGLGDIRALLGALPCPIQAVILVVLHRPVNRITNLRDILARASKIEVRIAGQDDDLQEGVCYIGEPDQHLTMAWNNLAEMIDDPSSSRRNRSIDALFISVASKAGSRMIGVVLSGSLDDGSRGLAAIHHAGGTTMVLDPTGQAFPQMARNAISYDGSINLVGTGVEIAAAISQLVAQAADDRDGSDLSSEVET